MIIIREFPNGKNVNCEVQQDLNDRIYNDRIYTVIHCKRSQSQNVDRCETLPEINLLQVQVPSQNNTRARKMHSPQSGCYDHVTSEI